MAFKRRTRDERGRKSIFRSLFVPLFLIMLLQATIFYFAAVYGGIEESLNQNAADILSERLANRKNELESEFNAKWANLEDCSLSLDKLYAACEESLGDMPLARNSHAQIQFLRESADTLIRALRRNEVNGIFLILNDQTQPYSAEGETQVYGLCIRDMDTDSNYTGTEDLLLERSPSSIVDALGCSLDSWWESRYTFTSRSQGDFYYEPLDAAWQNPGASGFDLAYCAGAHRLSASDPAVISYSIPLISKDGYPYAVLGVEISTRRLASLLPNKELNQANQCCYVLAIGEKGSGVYQPIVASGAMYSRCFEENAAISVENGAVTGGFWITGRENTRLYGDSAALKVYNNNNPFEDMQLTLLAMVEEYTMFGFIGRVKLTLFVVAVISLLLGVAGILWVSRRFAAPITALAGRVRGMKAQPHSELGRLGIAEIDQLVDSIDELNRNVSKNSARTEFFSRMSHDMRTPMNAIISFSSKDLLEGASEDVKDDYLEKIHASGEYLLGLINEVLDMTKIESNKTELRLEAIQARKLCCATVPMIETLAQKKNVKFQWEISIDPELYVLADEQHTSQIVMNLLSNAVKFTPAGGSVRLTAEAATDASDPARARCEIVVTDTGIGMSEEFIKKLYTPFEQENNRREGTGLGLSIAKKLVELMGGTIECASSQGVGTTFTVRIPYKKCAAPEELPESEVPTTIDLAGLAGKRVLVCEDNHINAVILGNLLSRKGVEMRVAEDGRAGLNAFSVSRPGEFDAIFMDIQMPVMDGLATTRAIRALERPDAKTIPIIAMTANAFQEDVRACAEAGMNEHLAKPIEPQKLYETLAAYTVKAE